MRLRLSARESADLLNDYLKRCGCIVCRVDDRRAARRWLSALPRQPAPADWSPNLRRRGASANTLERNSAVCGADSEPATWAARSSR